jgi:putative transcriptional regulator
MIHHHPSDESVLAYANGSLKRTLALALGAHLESCATCRESLAVAEALGGAALDSTPAAELPEEAFARALERLDQVAPASTSTTPRPFAERIGTVKQRWLAPGIWIHPILKDGAQRAYILGAAPGKMLPRHGHKGLEMTQVLKGVFFDSATRYGPGDFLEADEEVEHSLRVGPEEACICLVASEGVPRGLSGLLMRLMA